MAAQRMFALQGWPSNQVNVEVAETLQDSARKALRGYIRSVQPWQKLDDLTTEEEQKRQLLGDSHALMEEWVAYFEPENLEEFQQQAREAMERADHA